MSADAGSADMPRIGGYANHVYVAATPANDTQLRSLWSGQAIVVEPHDPELVTHKLALTRAGLHALRQQGITYTVLNSSFQAVLDAAYESWVHPPARVYSGPVPDWFARVQSLSAIFDYMDLLAQQSQGRASVKVIGRAFDQELRAMRISSAAEDGKRASILVTGTQHADEWLSPMVVTGLIWGLSANYESDAEVKKVVDNLNVYVIPVMNPDSYAQGNLARRTNQNPRCAGGVNLNRNWPSVGWGRGVEPCGGGNFPGDAALSEPETKAVKALADSLSQLVWYVDYHTPRQAVMIPYAWTSTKPKMYDEAKQAAQSYASVLGVRAQDGTIIGQGQGGGSLDYFQEALDDSGGISLCIEMTGSVDMRAPSTGIPDQVDKNLRAWLTVAAKLADAHPAPSSAGGAGGMSGASGLGAAGGMGVTGGVGGAPSATGGAGSGSAGAASGTGGAVAGTTAGTSAGATTAGRGASGIGAAGIGAIADAGISLPVAGSGAAGAAVLPSAGMPANAPLTTPANAGETKSGGCGVGGPAPTFGWGHALFVATLLSWRTRRRASYGS